MSSILKALKKLEKDKKINNPEQFGFDVQILEGSSPRFSRITVSLIVAVIFVSGSGATYFYMKRSIVNETIDQRSSSRIESINTPSLTLTTKTKNISPVLKISTLQNIPSTPITPKPAETILFNDTVKAPPPIQQVEIAPVSESRPVYTSPVPAKNVIRPTLTINGIAFQDGGSDNMAVINGVTVSNGAVIEGVLVEDILKDRVRFSHGVDKFDIILNRSDK